MNSVIRALVDAPLLRLAKALRRWSYLNTSVPPLLLEYRIQGWCRMLVGVAACFLVSRATADAFVGGTIFFLWILAVHALSLLAGKYVPRGWTDREYQAALQEAVERRDCKLLERTSALLMIAASVLLLAIVGLQGDPVGAAVAAGMLGLALAEAFRCYIRAADPPDPALRTAR